MTFTLEQNQKHHIIWFRRDLRCDDHIALHHAMTQNTDENTDQNTNINTKISVSALFIFDTTILSKLKSDDKRIYWLWNSLFELKQSLALKNIELLILYGNPIDIFSELASNQSTSIHLFFNKDYEPQARHRDEYIQKLKGITCHTFKDQVIFEENEVLSQKKTPFSVFTPYSKTWKKQLLESSNQTGTISLLKNFKCNINNINKDNNSDKNHENDENSESHQVQESQLSLSIKTYLKKYELTDFSQLNFTSEEIHGIKTLGYGMSGAKKVWSDFQNRINSYHETRDFPSIKGVSYLSVHLRFGTISIRELVRFAMKNIDHQGVEVWLNELIWREFYMQILFHNSLMIEKHQSFKKEYDQIQWETGAHAEQLFQAWCDGKTGYPLVDAAMLQLNQTGYMHNRLRMVTASFLIKHLGIDWRKGEMYFAQKLNDFDLSANNGGWQWAASSGCDAQPYFRIFNPITQSEKFDSQGTFIKRYLPQLAKIPAKLIHAPWNLSAMEQKSYDCVIGETYPIPIVEHQMAREKTLARYQVIRSQEK